MKTTIYESDVEEAALEWFAGMKYTVLHGPDIAPEEPAAERESFREVILKRRLPSALHRV